MLYYCLCAIFQTAWKIQPQQFLKNAHFEFHGRKKSLGFGMISICVKSIFGSGNQLLSL